MEKREVHNGMVGPIIVLGIGVLLLLSNLGMLQWSVWEALARLWPVLLIAAGLDMAIGRRSALGSFIVAVLMVAVLAGAIYLMASPLPGGRELAGEQVSQSLQDARSAQVEVRAGAASLRVGGGAASGQLLEGAAQVGQSEKVTADSRLENGVLIYGLRAEGASIGPVGLNGGRVWDLRLTGSVPVGLRLNLGAGEAIVDLREIKAGSLDLNIGAGSATVTVPAGRSLTANLKVAVGELVVRAPRGAALRVNGTGALAAVNLPGGRSGLGHVEYTSAGFEAATERIDLTVSCAVGVIRVVEY